MSQKLHERLSATIAASDLQYISGSILGAGAHPRLWPMSQWGVMITYETQQRLAADDPELSWDPAIAEAARHGGKFFDGKGDRNLDAVLSAFRSLIVANHEAFFPPRRGFAWADVLRNDLSVMTVDGEVVLTSVSGQFMLGFPPQRLVDFAEWGPHALSIMSGVGQAASRVFPGRTVEEFAVHGNHSESSVAWWDGKLADVIPATFAGELSPELALSLITIHSTVQAARRWTSTDCCAWCAAAALKHRFVVLHHAARSVEQLHRRIGSLGAVSAEHLDAMWMIPEIRRMTTAPFRRLRNGWLHLGLGDIEDRLPGDPDVLSVIGAYTGEHESTFATSVDTALDALGIALGSWMSAPTVDGDTMSDHLREGRVQPDRGGPVS